MPLRCRYPGDGFAIRSHMFSHHPALFMTLRCSGPLSPWQKIRQATMAGITLLDTGTGCAFQARQLLAS